MRNSGSRAAFVKAVCYSGGNENNYNENCPNNNALNNLFIFINILMKSFPHTFQKVYVFLPHLSQSACVLDIHSLQQYPSTHLKVSPNSFILSERTSKVRAAKRIRNYCFYSKSQNANTAAQVA